MSRTFHPFGRPRQWDRPITHRAHYRRWKRFVTSYPYPWLAMQWRWERAHRVIRNRQFRRLNRVDPRVMRFDAYVAPRLLECYYGWKL